MRQNICTIKDSECQEIQELYEKKLAYENLTKILSPNQNNEMYNRLITDYGVVIRQFSEWWDRIFATYNLSSGEYYIDFSSKEIYCNDIASEVEN